MGSVNLLSCASCCLGHFVWWLPSSWSMRSQFCYWLEPHFRGYDWSSSMLWLEFLCTCIILSWAKWCSLQMSCCTICWCYSSLVINIGASPDHSSSGSATQRSRMAFFLHLRWYSCLVTFGKTWLLVTYYWWFRSSYMVTVSRLQAMCWWYYKASFYVYVSVDDSTYSSCYWVNLFLHSSSVVWPHSVYSLGCDTLC